MDRMPANGADHFLLDHDREFPAFVAKKTIGIEESSDRPMREYDMVNTAGRPVPLQDLVGALHEVVGHPLEGL